ncbi:MAG: MaoC family dehydratase [Ruminiclostridium sp.]
MYLEDLEIGMTVKTEEVIIDKKKMMDFAAEYDPVPIHTDEEYAKNSRFGKLIAPGVMSFMAVWAKYIEVDFFGDQLVAGRSTKIEWHKPVFAGDILRGEAKITAISPRNPYNGIVQITMAIYNGENEQVMNSVVEAVVERKVK